MTTALVLSDFQDGVLTLTFNRPDKKHALTHAMYSELEQALAQAEQRREVRVIVVTGSGGVFSAGNDMGEFLNDPPQNLDFPVFRFLERLNTLQKPVIMAVSGLAIGIGTTMLLHADIVYCDATARFQMPFARLGLCPEAASSVLLPRIVGQARANELLLTGQMFNAARAEAIGLVAAVLENEEALLKHAREQALGIARQPAAAIRLTKQLLKKADKDLVAATLRHEGELFLARLHSPEGLEALQAFREKRQPDFSRFD